MLASSHVVLLDYQGVATPRVPEDEERNPRQWWRDAARQPRVIDLDQVVDEKLEFGARAG